MFALERLTDENMRAILERSLSKVLPEEERDPLGDGTPEPPSSLPLEGERRSRVSENIVNSIVRYSQGDARTALSLLELAINAPQGTNEEVLLRNLRKSVISRFRYFLSISVPSLISSLDTTERVTIIMT